MLRPMEEATTIKWKTSQKFWQCYNESNTGTQAQECNMTQAFPNHSDAEESFPLTTQEIAEA
jgi:hypothetical protein